MVLLSELTHTTGAPLPHREDHKTSVFSTGKHTKQRFLIMGPEMGCLVLSGFFPQSFCYAVFPRYCKRIPIWKKKKNHKNHKLSVILLNCKMLSTGRCVQILSSADEGGAYYFQNMGILHFTAAKLRAPWSTRMRGNLCISTQQSKQRTSMACQCFLTARSVNHSWAKINPVKIFTTFIFDRTCRSPIST